MSTVNRYLFCFRALTNYRGKKNFIFVGILIQNLQKCMMPAGLVQGPGIDVAKSKVYLAPNHVALCQMASKGP